ncbi:MAG: DUF1552 domain-containing protein [Gemmatimonadota bacterium]|nr:DUF1552 domain-containing protein [Gemmatimonadota bacterium]
MDRIAPRLITGKHLPRRTFLRGLGATVALPFLDAMVPARERWAVTRARNALDRTRLVAIEMVHGSAGSNAWGASQHLWSPPETGRDFDFGPSVLSSLEPYRDQLTIISDTDVEGAEATKPKEIGGDHFRSSATFLTQSHPKQTESSDVWVGTSLDQLYAERFGQDTPIPSMQLCIENVDQAGGCAYGYACVYTDTISWAAPDQPLPMVRDPRVAFDQLFGAGGTPEARAARRRTSSSVLDFIVGEVNALKRQLDPVDGQRVDRYLNDIREIERRIARVVARNESGEERALPGAPAGVPDSFDEHVKLMFDLQALAFESDVTGIFSFKMGRDASSRVYPESGVEKGFHPSSHHGGRPANVLEFAEINRYHVGLVPYFLERLASIQEGDASLLDRTMVIYGSPMGDSNVHNHKRCPLFVVGGANGRLDGNLHLRAAPGTPMANVMLSLMHKLGMEDVTSFGNSTGVLGLSG